MVLIINKIFRIILITSILFISGCEELYIVDCSECDVNEPTDCLLQIKLQVINGASAYDVTIYRGKIEDGVVVYNIGTASSFSYRVGLNSEYTVTATTVINGKVYTAIDSTRPKVKEITDACDDVCYWVINKSVNLKFKYL